ncbi:helix-turn-helix domain-containing protein, partial [Streptomyces albidoflavus]|uniref:helix-turn-helix domain-containing protein n=1 Tax=Streptomyces albidoflavus TaxID=1886 RepID=UPI0033A4E392
MTNRPAPTLPAPAERRRLREAASLSQAALAARMSVTSTTIHSWETGRTTPRGRALEAYATFLTTTADRPGPAGEPVRKRPTQPGTAARKGEDKARTEVVREAEAPPEPARAEASRPRPARPEPPRPSSRRPGPTGASPREAFDALYASCAGVLVRQAYLLTGRHTVAVESVERAFQLAWARWPEVAVDRDPAGWVRAAAHEYALSPWHRMRAAHRSLEWRAAPPRRRLGGKRAEGRFRDIAADP